MYKCCVRMAVCLERIYRMHRWEKIVIVVLHIICIMLVFIAIAEEEGLLASEKGTPAEGLHITITPELQGEMARMTPTPTNKSETTVMPTQIPTPTTIPIPTDEQTVTPPPVPTLTPTAVPTNTPTPVNTPVPTDEFTSQELRELEKQTVLQQIMDGAYDSVENKKYSWWFLRKKNQVPSGSGAAFSMSEYHAFYRDETAETVDNVIYMTIDCGYGSKNTEIMLDTFKKHDVKVMFFVTKFFIEANPDYVRRMVEEGHLVGNHSVSHADLTALTAEEIYEEIIGCEEAFFQVTGKQMDLYFRPPEGAYSKRTLQLTSDLGYKTIFWSIAYNDYDKSNQPGKAFVIDHFNTYHHNGAIPLMHNDSDSNMEAMDEVLTLLKELGYRFGTLDELE